jgi:hypothetical protein
LLGNGSGLAVNPQGVVRPVLTGPVVLADGNTLDFLRIAGTAGDAVDGNGQNGGTVTNCEIANTTANGEGVGIEGSTGIWNVSNNTITNIVEIGVFVTTTGSSSLTVTINNNDITNCGLDAIGFSSLNTSQITAQVQGNTMTGNVAGATFEAIALQASAICLDIENNTNDDVYLFDRVASATLEVEQFATPTIPSNTGTAQLAPLSDPVTAVNDGACGF